MANQTIKNDALLQSSYSSLKREKLQQQEGKRFLQFSLKKKVSGLVFLQDLLGTIEITLTDILPIPQVPEYWLGITNYQGEAVWILDLAQLVNDAHWLRKSPIVSSGMAMLISIEGKTIGLLVEQIQGIENYDLKSCLPIAEINTNARTKSLFKGYFLSSKGEPSMLLNIDSLFYLLQE